MRPEPEDHLERMVRAAVQTLPPAPEVLWVELEGRHRARAQTESEMPAVAAMCLALAASALAAALRPGDWARRPLDLIP